MASRSKQKEEARARRLAEQQARTEKVRRQRRLQMTIGIVLVAVIVIGAAIAISSGGGKAKGLATGTTLTQTKSAVSTELAGIPQSGAILGNAKAPVTMFYYGDLECPVCQDFTLGRSGGGFPQLLANEVKQGKVKVEYRAFETATRDPTTFQTQQVAALAAGKQNHFWDFTELFYRQQGAEGTNYVTESYLDSIARQIPGLNLSEWTTARGDSSLAAQVQSDGSQGTNAGVTGTPTLIFQGPSGKATALSGVPSYSDLQKSIHGVS
jgi:protein-disulfide isomerase